MSLSIDSEVTNLAGPKIRIAIVGLRFGANIARVLMRGNPWLEVVALCDRDQARASQISSELHLPLKTLEELLEDQTIEAIGLFTGPVNRAELIQKLIRAGKDVMTTKPFELDPEAAWNVLEEARTLGRIVHLNSPGPTLPEDICQILEWQNAHALGRPLAMRAETYASYREKSDGTWYDDPEICGAAPLLRLGIYFFNEFARLPGDPAFAHVMHSRLFTQRPTSDHAQIGIQYKNGALGNIFASFCIDDGKPYRDLVTFNYEKATIRRWMEKTPPGSMTPSRAVVELDSAATGNLQIKTTPGNSSGSYQWEAFYNAVRQRILAGPEGHEEILFGIRLLAAASLSFKSGQPEQVGIEELSKL